MLLLLLLCRTFKEQAVKGGDKIDLGGGHVLEFVMAPNLHWPDTMFSYDAATGVMYTCDAFGMHYCTEDPFDVDLQALLPHYRWGPGFRRGGVGEGQGSGSLGFRVFRQVMVLRYRCKGFCEVLWQRLGTPPPRESASTAAPPHVGHGYLGRQARSWGFCCGHGSGGHSELDADLRVYQHGT